jgi:pimeloyl-ACP methyl ester carboxylesterase
MGSTMERVPVNGAELEVDVKGAGEPVVFIHGAVFTDSFLSLVIDPAVRDHYRTIRYRRRGYGGSSPVDAPFSVSDHASDCRALLGALDVEKAHVVGHSYGGVVALQLAVGAPEVVATLGLFEPALLAVPSAPQFFEEVGPIVERYRSGDRVGAVHAFVAAVGGPNWREHVERTVPGGVEQGENDAATLFESDLPTLEAWEFGADETAKINQPVLFMLGSDSVPLFGEGRDLLRSWLPRTEDAGLAGATHLLQMQRPADAAAALADFLKRLRETALRQFSVCRSVRSRSSWTAAASQPWGTSADGRASQGVVLELTRAER